MLSDRATNVLLPSPAALVIRSVGFSPRKLKCLRCSHGLKPTLRECLCTKIVDRGVPLPPLPTGGVTFEEDVAVGRGPG